MGAAASLLVGSAYLLAGAAESDWGREGAECFASGTHRLVNLFERYPSHWRKWLKAVKTHPLCLPKLVTTTEIMAVPLEVQGEPWTIRCVDVSPAAGTAGWWEVGPLEETLGIRQVPAPLLAEMPMEISLSDSPYPEEAEVESAEDHRRFDRGDPQALWRMVRNPPNWWKFWWFPGDVDFVGKTLEEAWGDDAATLLVMSKNIKTWDDLRAAQVAVDKFVKTHPGDPTAISAARDCVFAERQLRSRPPDPVP
jgi:hypothetical protein